MNTQLLYLQEPNLLFGYNQLMTDPRDGLTLFGPYEGLAPHKMQVGVIGTEEGIERYKVFVERLRRPIYSPKEKLIQRPHFPGFETIFGVQWSSKPDAIIHIRKEAIEQALNTQILKERTFAVVNLYLDKLKQFDREEETKVDLWFVIVPRQVWLHCRPESQGKGSSDLSVQAIRAHEAGQMVMFNEMAEEIEETIEIHDSSSDFHNQLKARLLKERVQPPVQVILDSTLQFREKYHLQEYTEEMKAHLAWTQSSTIFYKLGKLPWKLQGIRRGVCYVGLTFKKFERATKRGYACSAAQMFLDSGDGTVFRGNIGPWLSRNERDFHLDYKSAKDLITKALLSYSQKKGEYPSEMFIHGRAHFTGDEWHGFSDAVQAVSPKTRLVGIVIQSSGKFKLFRHVPDEASLYGNLRGVAFILDKKESYLFTRGYVPRLNTSLSLEIPNPLRVQISRGEADIEQVLKDILALSKLNYNACIYGDGLPVTLRFSDSIGSILTAIDKLEVEVLPFKYYI